MEEWEERFKDLTKEVQKQDEEPMKKDEAFSDKEDNFNE